MNDEGYLAKQIEALVGYKKTLIHKYDSAKELYEVEKKRREEAKASAKLEAYNNWRLEEEKKGRQQDEHSKNLVKKMMKALKTSDENPDTVSNCMCSVLGNIDGI